MDAIIAHLELKITTSLKMRENSVQQIGFLCEDAKQPNSVAIGEWVC
jgi:hypothetical protein